MLQASERCVREYRFEVDVPGADGHEGAICRWMRGVVISSRTCRTSSRGLLTVSRRSSSNCRWPLDSFVRPDTCRWSKGSHEVSEDAPTRSPSAFPQLPKGLRPGLRVPTRICSWKPSGMPIPRRAAVSCFGSRWCCSASQSGSLAHSSADAV